MELLWSEEDPVKTAKRFHVALASLRKALEPGLLKGIPSSYLSSDRDATALSFFDYCGIDLPFGHCLNHDSHD